MYPLLCPTYPSFTSAVALPRANQQPELKATKGLTKGALFPFEVRGYKFQNPNQSLLDCFLLFTLNSDLVNNLLDNEEVCQAILNSENYQNVAEFIKMLGDTKEGKPVTHESKKEGGQLDELVSYINSITSNMQHYLISERSEASEPVTFKQIVELIATKAPEASPQTFLYYLANLLFRDIQKFKAQEPALEYSPSDLADKAKLEEFCQSPSCKSSRLFSELLSCVTSGTEETFEMDAVSEQVINLMSVHILPLLKGQVQSLGNSVEMPHLKGRFSRFDLTNQIQFGLWELDPAYCVTTKKIQVIYFIPNNDRQLIQNMTVTSEICFEGETQKDRGYHYSAVEDLVRKCEGKDNPYLFKDFDWCAVMYDVEEDKFFYSGSQDPVFRANVRPSEILMFASKDVPVHLPQTFRVLVTLETNVRTLRNCTKFMYTLFVWKDESATIKDLIEFVTKSLGINLSEKNSKDVLSWLHFSTSGNRQNSTCESSDQTLVSVRNQLNGSSERAVNELDLICYVKTKDKTCFIDYYDTTPMVDKDAEPSIYSIPLLNKVMKNDPQHFFSFFLDRNLGQHSEVICSKALLSSKRPEYFLPSILLVKVALVSHNLIDPKLDFYFDSVKKALEVTGNNLSSHYKVKGLVCSKTEGAYYPVLVTGERDCIEYEGQARNTTLDHIKDEHVHYVFLQRAEYDI